MERPVGIYASSASRRDLARRRGWRGRMRLTSLTVGLAIVLVAVLAVGLAS